MQYLDILGASYEGTNSNMGQKFNRLKKIFDFQNIMKSPKSVISEITFLGSSYTKVFNSLPTERVWS